MKTLLVLRHAKSSWKSLERSDHERPLNKCGERDAPRIGRLVAERKILPDVIVASTAKRAHRTAQAVAVEIGRSDRVQFDQRLYLATAAEILKVLAAVGGSSNCLMVVGHNPGLEDLVTRLTGADEALPTAALADIRLSIRNWTSLMSKSVGHLEGLWRPRTLND